MTEREGKARAVRTALEVVCAKQEHLQDVMTPPPGVRDVWTWTAIDTESKLIISCPGHDRSLRTAETFVRDLASPIRRRPGPSHHGRPAAYPEAVGPVFVGHMDHGTADLEGISNRFVEHRNLTLRTAMKRFARKSNAGSKKVENTCWRSLPPPNFWRVHQPVRMSAATAAGITKPFAASTGWTAQRCSLPYERWGRGGSTCFQDADRGTPLPVEPPCPQ